jgi:hypothetical protein
VLAGVGVSPNSSGLPGIAELENIVGALLTIGLIASLAGLVISAIVWAIGNHSANPCWPGGGRQACSLRSSPPPSPAGAVTLINFFAAPGRTCEATRTLAAVALALGIVIIAGGLDRALASGGRHRGGAWPCHQRSPGFLRRRPRLPPVAGMPSSRRPPCRSADAGTAAVRRGLRRGVLVPGNAAMMKRAEALASPPQPSRAAGPISL